MTFNALFDGNDARLLDPALCVATLRHYNAWRRGSETIEQPDPVAIGLAIDVAIMLIEDMPAAVAKERAACLAIIDVPHWKPAVRQALKRRADEIRARNT